MLERGDITDDLNVSSNERLKAVLAGVFALSILGAVAGIVPWWLAGALLLAAGAANIGLVGIFNRRKGPLFALGGLLMHQLYYLYSSAAFVWAFIRVKLFSRR
jgi:hypothetical protein